MQNRSVNPRGLVRYSTFDSVGNLVSDKEAGTEGGVVKSIETTYSYDRNGNVISKTKQDGTTNWYSYNAKGQIVRAVYEKNAAGQDVHYTTYGYDDAGNCLWMKDYKNNDETPVTQSSYAYDGLNRVKQYVQNGDVVNYEYDALSNITQLSYRGGAVSGQENQTTDLIEINYAYNTHNQLFAITVSYDGAGSKKVADYEYSPTGRLSAQKDHWDVM